MLRWLAILVCVLLLLAGEGTAWAQACCAGASGLTPGWLTHHERFLVGTQLRMAATHGTYPTSGSFYVPPPGRDFRLETSLFGSVRLLPRAQASLFAPLTIARRRANGVVEERVAPGDVALIGRYDLVRAGESRWPGLALLAGGLAPTGPASDQGDGLLAANVTGTGAWEVNGGASIEQVFGHVVLHGTVLVGGRLPRDVAGVDQQLGIRALYLLAGGWTFDDETSILATVTHLSEGDATIADREAPGTGYRTTQVALLFILPLSDTLRLRTTVFTDVPPLGVNRPALGGTSFSIAKSWL